MTYKEHFMKCETEEELLKEARGELAFAMVLNTDRIKVIKQAVEEVLAEKFNVPDTDVGKKGGAE